MQDQGRKPAYPAPEERTCYNVATPDIRSLRGYMRLLYTSDLHGNSGLYQAMLDMALQQQVEAVIVGGDLLPHAIKLDQAIATQRDFVTQKLRPLLEQFRRTAPSTACYLLPGNDDWAAG